MTKKEALSQFKEFHMPNIPSNDKPALRQAWNDYTDYLCKDKQISLKQYETWDNPF